MGGIGWRAGALGAAAGALTGWVAAPWVSMAVHGTVDGRHAASLRRRQPRPDRLGAGVGGVLRRMPSAWDTIPGPRPQVRARPGRTGAASS